MADHSGYNIVLGERNIGQYSNICRFEERQSSGDVTGRTRGEQRKVEHRGNQK